MARARFYKRRGRGRPRNSGGMVGGILKVLSMEFGGLFSLYVLSSLADVIVPLVNDSTYFAGIETYVESFFPLLGLLVVVLPIYWFVRRYMK